MKTKRENSLNVFIYKISAFPWTGTGAGTATKR